ncbi:WD40-repeat-containing domain protein [Apodospora peruviana]|uniref:WD40-repeat-containing domain protein n=1 Tax=Apodospora peruviana TaxID=516989 RepID=A0AAE0M4X3_9PEZI|nr:WD40-repeat-containing domain protein [Apodospora peruviana]
MRLRKARGIRKSYVEQPVALDDDDEEPIVVPDDQSGDDDFDAQPEGGQSNHGDDDDDDEEEDDDEDNDEKDEDVVPSSEDEEDDDAENDEAATGGKASAGGAAAATTSTKPKKQRNAGVGMIQSRKNFHDIPHYPLETRIVTRVYAGPLRRYARYSALRDSMYGPEYQRIKIIWDLEKRWQDFSVLPPKFPPASPKGVVPSPWVPLTFERDQERAAFYWYDEYQVNASDSEIQQSREIPAERGERLVPQAGCGGDLAVLVGPWDAQKEVRISPGSSLSISMSGLPVDDPDAKGEESAGWMFDVGGIPLAMGWAPSTRKDAQLLAVASIPFSDQELAARREDGRPTAASEKPNLSAGSIQFWEFDADRRNPGLASTSANPPRLLVTRCFDWGRPKRLQWCPVPLDAASTCGLLAVLCGDGRARVLDVNKIKDSEPTYYEWMKSAVVTLGISSDYDVDVTCLAWVNVNRIVLGHSDGSITLWSVYPGKMLQRLGVHTTYVIDICSGYPSNPYLVASIPVGGCATLTDLSQPSSEFTYFPVPAISFQPNMLCWNEPMQGFMALYPSSTPNTTVAFLHHRYFCQARSMCTGPNTVTCISAGASHPFLLMGCLDGSVYSCNALQKLFKQKGEPLRKIKVFEHEYRPVVDSKRSSASTGSGGVVRPIRGAARILQSFLPELNDDPRTEKRKELDRKRKSAAKKKKGGPGRKKKNAGADGEEEEKDPLAELDDKLASRVITHEPLTRVTTIEWNPNLQFSCWVACSMGSGLVKVMDLGVK